MELKLWGTTVASDNKIQSFINRSLRQIQGVYWPICFSNEDLRKDIEQLPHPMEINGILRENEPKEDPEIHGEGQQQRR